MSFEIAGIKSATPRMKSTTPAARSSSARKELSGSVDVRGTGPGTREVALLGPERPLHKVNGRRLDRRQRFWPGHGRWGCALPGRTRLRTMLRRFGRYPSSPGPSSLIYFLNRGTSSRCGNGLCCGAGCAARLTTRREISAPAPGVHRQMGRSRSDDERWFRPGRRPTRGSGCRCSGRSSTR